MPVQTTYGAEYFYTEHGQLKNKLQAAQLDQFVGEDQRVEVSGGSKWSSTTACNKPKPIFLPKMG